MLSKIVANLLKRMINLNLLTIPISQTYHFSHNKTIAFVGFLEFCWCQKLSKNKNDTESVAKFLVSKN